MFLKIFSVTEIAIGILAIFLQVNTYLTYNYISHYFLVFVKKICELIIFRSNYGLNDPDIVSAGIWGGTFLILFGVLLMSKRYYMQLSNLSY